MKTTVRLAAFAVALAGASAHAEGLSPIEERLAADVRANSGAAIEFLEKTVRVNSGTLNLDGVREVGRLFAAEFESLGFTTRWIAMPPEMNRAGHFVAARKGTKGKRLLLIGHLDTVFEKTSSVPLWDRRDGTVRGQGATDMKGGDVIVLEALRALHREGALDDASITVFFTGDEERVGTPVEKARADFIEAAKASDIALAFEGTVVRDGRPTATIARRASSGWVVRITAKPGHSAGVFSESSGYGAIYEGARIINAFREQLRETDLTYNIGLAVGGTTARYEESTATANAFGKSNVIPEHMEIVGDLRYVDYAQRDRTHQRMREIVAQSLPHTKSTISFREAYPPMAPTEGNLRLREMYSRASADAGLGTIEPLPISDRGAGDVQFVAPYVDSLDGLGSTGKGSHTDNEELEIASIERGAIRAAVTIYRLTR
jgi:glutamate carboxypeptidase